MCWKISLAHSEVKYNRYLQEPRGLTWHLRQCQVWEGQTTLCRRNEKVCRSDGQSQAQAPVHFDVGKGVPLQDHVCRQDGTRNAGSCSSHGRSKEAHWASQRFCKSQTITTRFLFSTLLKFLNLEIVHSTTYMVFSSLPFFSLKKTFMGLRSLFLKFFEVMCVLKTNLK